MKSRWTRRGFLFSLPTVAAWGAESNGKGRVLPSVVQRFPDPATEFIISRITDPSHTSVLSAYYNRVISKHSNFMLYASDLSGRFEAYRMDLKSGQSRQLTDAANLAPASLALTAGDHDFYYFDGPRLMNAHLSTLKTRQPYAIPEKFELGSGFSVAEDGMYAAVIEKNDTLYRLQLIQTATGTATKLVECDEELRDPIPRPKRASILYRRAGGLWLVNYDARQNYRLRVTDDGEIGPALWSPDGHSVLYLNYPEDRRKLHSIREFTPDTNEDKLIATTSQFVHFGCNADASVFVGASGSKASPYVLLLVRAVRRELTLAEHRATDPQMVAPIFAPNSQRIFFTSDQQGKPALYTMSVDKFVEETDTANG